MFRSVTTLKQLRRCFSTKSAPILEALHDKSLLRISGNEVSDYLQGLITNDMNHLMNHGTCMYAMFLNTKGRVLYDVIIYKTIKDNTYLIECDTKAVDSLQKHLKIYKLRRKIDIVNLTDELAVHALFNLEHLNVTEELDLFNKNIDNVCDNLNKELIKENKSIKLFNDISIYQDPRMSLLGSRIITPKNISVKDEITKLTEVKTQLDTQTYKWFRYNLGVGEGVNDLPPENCFPLEANCDYLHGVSFHKGCYIGQELTARTYHTGVVRKRLMPLIFSKVPTKSGSDSNIISDNVNLGKLRGIEGDVGLALLRIAKSVDLKEIKISDGIATSHHKMETIKQEQLEETASETNIKIEDDKTQPKPEIVKLPSFQCAICQLNEKYDYFGMNPPYMRHYLLLEDSYTIEDPFLPLSKENL
ncbi:hypothetical protein MML48_2g00014727 [Holotrichia oblita]|uniref:Uncharacterized protein n=1 Tax=Holotrichia oblita TaxID=644536 RepID=A0ACB9TJX8_HOLOL|nr:hypothetical protein MML48_2g00014727 [Holotrichia oblita]